MKSDSPFADTKSAAPTGQAPPVRPEYLPLSLLRAAWKQKTAFAGCTALLAFAGVVAYRLIPATYRAETLILVEAQKIPERLVDSTTQSDLTDRLSTIQQQILSRTRLTEIMERHGLRQRNQGTSSLAEDLEDMRSDISVKIERGWSRSRPGAIRVAYAGRDPVVAAAIANDLGRLFIEENERARGQHSEGTAEFLADQLNRSRARLEGYESRLAAYKKTHSGELPEQAQALLSTIARLQMDLQSRQEAMMLAQQNRVLLEASLRSAENTLAEIQRLQAAPAPLGRQGSTQGGAASASPAVAPTKQSEVLEAQLAALTQRYSDKHPAVRELRAEIELARQRESTEAASRPATARTGPGTAATAVPAGDARPADFRQALETGQVSERISALKAQLESLRREADQRQRDRDQISQELAAAQARLSRIPVHEQELLTLLRDYEGASAQYKSLNDKNFSAGMAAEMERRQQAERFAILETAQVPDKPFRPDRRKGILVIGLGSLALGAAFAFLRELRQGVILGEWELPQDIVILGRVPTLP